MTEVAEVVNDVEHVEKETEKKVIEVTEEKEKETETEKEEESKPKENGNTETNGKSEHESNGISLSEVASATKRKSGAGDAPEGTPTEGATPEKKAKISSEDKDSTNGESEVASDGANEAKNMSYQKHF